MKVLVVISPIRNAPSLIDFVKRHREDWHNLMVLYSIDREIINKLARRWSDEGWLSSATTHRIRDTIVKDYQERAEKYHRLLVDAFGRPVSFIVDDSRFVDAVIRLVSDEQPELVVMVRRIAPRWLRRILHTDGERLIAQLDCRVISIEPEK